MCPAQFVTQCVTNRKRPVEESHVPQVGGIEAGAELCRKRLCQQRQKLLAIRGSGRAALLKLHDVPSDFPTGTHLDGIDGSQSPLAGTLNQIAKGF